MTELLCAEGLISMLWTKTSSGNKQKYFMRLEDDSKEDKPYSQFGGIPLAVQEAFDGKTLVYVSYTVSDSGDPEYPWRNIQNINVRPGDSQHQVKLPEKEDTPVTKKTPDYDEYRRQDKELMLECLEDTRDILDTTCRNRHFDLPFNPADIAAALYAGRVSPWHYRRQNDALLKKAEEMKKSG